MKKRKVGRPKLKASDRLTTITITITPQQRENLRKTFPNGDCSKFFRRLLDGELFAKLAEEN